jgi:transposase-like protein
MTREQGTTRRYSISFRQMVVREIEEGASIEFVKRKYGIGGGGTVQNWIVRFGKNHLLNKVVRIETMNEKDQIKELQKQLRETKAALADSIVAQRCLEILIEEANKEYKTDIKKNFGDDASGREKKS